LLPLWNYASGFEVLNSPHYNKLTPLQMRRPSLFKKRDVTRATNGVLDAGLEVARVEITKDGVIVVVPGKPSELPPKGQTNEWDEILNGTP
jgi:hypothetical protein